MFILHAIARGGVGSSSRRSKISSEVHKTLCRFDAQAIYTHAVCRTMILQVVPSLFLQFLAYVSGMAVFAYFASSGCDPLAAGHVTNSNQVIRAVRHVHIIFRSLRQSVGGCVDGFISHKFKVHVTFVSIHNYCGSGCGNLTGCGDKWV